MTEPVAAQPVAKQPGMAGPLFLTLLLLPLGLILSLVWANKARQAGQSQQPIWTGFAIGAVLDIALWVLLTRG